MSLYKETFPNRHTILPVVHVQDNEQVTRNIEIAKGSGCDGVFLINMQTINMRIQDPYTGHKRLLDFYDAARSRFPDFWIGLNSLSLPTDGQIFALVPRTVSGIWNDNAGIVEDRGPQYQAYLVNKIREMRHFPGLYFGGVAFKYQQSVRDLARVSRIATNYMDVVTTSGEGTGQPPEIEKIRTMKEAIGDTPLAIASGISLGNVRNYLDYADCFLVASSLLKRGTEDFDTKRVEDLVKAVI